MNQIKAIIFTFLPLYLSLLFYAFRIEFDPEPMFFGSLLIMPIAFGFYMYQDFKE